MLLFDFIVRHGGVEVVQGWIRHSRLFIRVVVTGRHVFAGEDDERETFSASSDKRTQFLLPGQVLAYLPLAGPNAEMYAQPFGKSPLTKYLYQTAKDKLSIVRYVEILQSGYIRC